MVKDDLTVEIVVPEGITPSLQGTILVIKGQKGEVRRNFANPKVLVKIDGSKIVLHSKKVSKRENKLVRTFESHIKNMINGAKDGVNYKLKICSGHFPMNVTVSGQDFSIKNFLGEKVPRKLALKPGVSVKLDGTIINVDGIDIELVSQTAADIEQLTRRSGFDKRVFQDGIYIIAKDGKDIK